MKITVFTPTYNRGHLLNDLFSSLYKQDFDDFEWLIVDDGSEDSTEEIIRSYMSDTKFPIRFYRTQNGGKHRAINFAVERAAGELFFIVDSDDRITPNALNIVWAEYQKVAGLAEFAGVCGLKVYPDGSKIGGEESWTELECSSLDYRYKFNGKGDMAEVYRTLVLRKFLFPTIEGEKFCSESVVWNRIATKYKLLFFYIPIYIAEYLEDGLSFNSVVIRHQSPKSAILFYSELVAYQATPLTVRIKSWINIWRFSFCLDKRSFLECVLKNRVFSILFLPVGFLFYLRDRKKISTNIQRSVL